MVVTALVATAAATTYATIEANNRAREQRKQQERALEQQRIANQQAKETAEAEAQRADIAYNQANQQQPEVQAIISRSQEAATQGPAATVLTGGNNMVNPVAQAVAKGKSKKGGGRGDASGGSLLTGQVGVDPSALNLGGNSLLGN